MQSLTAAYTVLELTKAVYLSRLYVMLTVVCEPSHRSGDGSGARPVGEVRRSGGPDGIHPLRPPAASARRSFWRPPTPSATSADSPLTPLPKNSLHPLDQLHADVVVAEKDLLTVEESLAALSQSKDHGTGCRTRISVLDKITSAQWAHFLHPPVRMASPLLLEIRTKVLTLLSDVCMALGQYEACSKLCRLLHNDEHNTASHPFSSDATQKGDTVILEVLQRVQFQDVLYLQSSKQGKDAEALDNSFDGLLHTVLSGSDDENCAITKLVMHWDSASVDHLSVQEYEQLKEVLFHDVDVPESAESSIVNAPTSGDTYGDAAEATKVRKQTYLAHRVALLSTYWENTCMCFYVVVDVIIQWARLLNVLHQHRYLYTLDCQRWMGRKFHNPILPLCGDAGNVKEIQVFLSVWVLFCGVYNIPCVVECHLQKEYCVRWCYCL